MQPKVPVTSPELIRLGPDQLRSGQVGFRLLFKNRGWGVPPPRGEGGGRGTGVLKIGFWKKLSNKGVKKSPIPPEGRGCSRTHPPNPLPWGVPTLKSSLVRLLGSGRVSPIQGRVARGAGVPCGPTHPPSGLDPPPSLRNDFKNKKICLELS